ncbi:sensor histidine kinase [Halobaculum halobium]|uniref:histidine kinase n=1 Tax=Halobaculum halobium TaxID=3032281 RepID=A0ABD5TBN6_9EURY|nr:ATP-binding protein [Halobaculum sp. SYNS20]
MTRLVATSLGAGVVVGGLSAVYVVSRYASNEPVSEAWFILSIGWSLGSSSGGLVGYYVERVRAERAAQAQLTGRLTVLQRVLRHNIRNEVGVIRGVAASAAETTDQPQVAADLRTLIEHVDRVHELSEKAQTLADLWNVGDPIETNLGAVARAEVSSFHEDTPEVDVRTSIPDRAVAVVHPAAGKAIREALDNAARHNDEEVTVTITVAEDGPWTTVTIVDDGSSIPAEELEAIAELREFPLKHVTGLGLWVIYWVVELSGGRLTIENRDQRGVRVEMRFRSENRARVASEESSNSDDPADDVDTAGDRGLSEESGLPSGVRRVSD